MNESKFNTNLLKWYYNDEDILVALVDKVGKSDDFSGGTIYCFYTTELQAEKDNFVNYLHNLNMEFTINPNGIFYITDLYGETAAIHIMFKSINDYFYISPDKHDYIYDKYMLNNDPKNIEHYEIYRNPPPELPIPIHLNKIFVPDEKKSTHFKVYGELRCTCKNMLFQTKTPIVNGEIDKSYIKAACNKCSREHLVFDSHIHGWNGFICHNVPRRPFDMKVKNFHCIYCNSKDFNINICISSQGKDDFISELKKDICKGKITKDEWVNAFERININLVCITCGYDYSQFVDYETM